MAAHAKRFVPDAAVKAANTCTQVLGGMGLLKPYGLDRLSRLPQMLQIVDGKTEISHVVIGRALQKRAAELPDLSIPKALVKRIKPLYPSQQGNPLHSGIIEKGWRF